MDSDVKPPLKKKKTNTSPSLLMSLPGDIIVNCLARISKLYYPQLSLVCKTFCSLILSHELYIQRMNLGTHEHTLHVCLKLPTSSRPSWFSLWTKPGQTLTKDINKKNKSKGNTLLVPIPSSYSPRVPMFIAEIDADSYAISKYNITPSSTMWVQRNEHYNWCKAPSMKVARDNVVSCLHDGKIYVMGGYEGNVAEVFDSKTQTWELLPNLEAKLSPVKTLEVIEGKIHVKSQWVEYVYDPKEGKWDDEAKISLVESKCEINNVLYRCGRNNVMWYDTKHEEWRDVKGLDPLNKKRLSYLVETANYGGKLLIMWEKYVHPGRQNKNIWCAVIALEMRKDDEVWGKIEWASIVLTVPKDYAFLRCEVKPV